jgi:hypothetical protein
MMLRELKARKAKFGFDGGIIHLGNVIEIGEFMKAMQNAWSTDKYIMEEAGYNRPELKIYTDDHEVAEWIRLYAKLDTK